MSRNKTDLLPYQNAGIDELYQRDAVQFVVPMGGGKTVMALTTIQELLRDNHIRRALVIAPKRVAQLVWPSELKEWTHLKGLSMAVGVGDARARREALFSKVDIVVQTIDNLQWMLDELKGVPDDDPIFDLLCIDESSRFKNPRSKRGAALSKVSARWRIKWGMTGTPAPNGLLDQFGPLRVLSDGRLWGKSYDKWLRVYGVPLDYKGYKWDVNPFMRKQVEADIRKYSYVVQPDQLKELPELVTRRHEVLLPDHARARYDTLLKEFIARCESGTVTAANMAVATGKMEQALQGFLYTHDVPGASDDYERFDDSKVRALADLVDGVGGEPVLIAYWYKAELDALRGVFGKDLPYIGAGLSDKRVAAYSKAWNEGKLPVMAIHPASAGHGLNLQHGGSQMIATMPIWSAEYWDQLLKRIHRTGQTKRTFVHVLHGVFTPGGKTVDHTKAARVIDKLDASAAFSLMLQK